MPLTLYYHPLASFCHKVLIALYENHTEFDRRAVDLGNESDRAELQALWPLTKFPVIRDEARDRILPETSIIIEYLDRFYAGEQPLIPDGWEEALNVRLWDRFFDAYVQGPMQQIVADRLRGSHGNLTQERALLTTAYGMIERQLDANTWIASRQFSMADCAAAPALFYAGTVQPFPGECGRLRAYFDRLTERPSVKRVLDEAKPYFSMYPFAEAIPPRFLV